MISKGDSLFNELKTYCKENFKEEEIVSSLINDWNSKPRDTRDSVEEFYSSTRAYLYDLTRWHSSLRYPYPMVTGNFARKNGFDHILEFGCGIGTDGLYLLEQGFKVSFYDFRNACTEYLSWRLKQRGFSANIYYAGEDELPENDLTLAVDVIEHLVDPENTLKSITKHTSAVSLHIPFMSFHKKYPMHFSVNKKRLYAVMRKNCFRHVQSPSFYLQDFRALLLFLEKPQFWIKDH